MGKTYQRVIELLKNEFEVKKTTKYAFCKATGINPTSVERYLCGISEPNQSSLEKLADYFGVTVSWLRGEEPFTLQEADFPQLLKEAVEKHGVLDVAKGTGLPESKITDCIKGSYELNIVEGARTVRFCRDSLWQSDREDGDIIFTQVDDDLIKILPTMMAGLLKSYGPGYGITWRFGRFHIDDKTLMHMTVDEALQNVSKHGKLMIDIIKLPVPPKKPRKGE